MQQSSCKIGCDIVITANHSFFWRLFVASQSTTRRLLSTNPRIVWHSATHTISNQIHQCSWSVSSIYWTIVLVEVSHNLFIGLTAAWKSLCSYSDPTGVTPVTLFCKIRPLISSIVCCMLSLVISWLFLLIWLLYNSWRDATTKMRTRIKFDWNGRS